MPQGATAQAPQSIQNPALILEGAVKPQGDAPANAAAGAQPLAAQSVLVSKEGQPPPVAQNPQTGTQAAPPSGETAAFSREAAVTQTVDPKPDAAIMKPPPDGVVKEPSAAVVSRELPAQQQGLEPNPNIKPQAESQSGSALHVPHSALTRETAIPDERTLFAQVKQRLLFDPNGTSNKDVDEFLNRLRDSIEAARAELAKSNAPETGRLMRELTFVRESLEFVNHIKENIYLQLPISVHNNETNGEILVFRNKQRKKKEDGSVSALIALDTLKLGRFEVYVQKTGKSVNCQFRLRDEKIESLTRANIPRLQAMLTAQGYSLSEVTYKKAEESFTLLDKPREESSETPLGKFAFDMKM
ncbi:MAG: flagellar hook-length control protein FliK, partial [Defluviitaleaceae bacterium]|nr:flagellar hook-length control protein FliK [Defluviitaleaceae bacterium]